MGSMGVLIKSQSQILEKLTYHMHFIQYFTHHKFKCKTSHLTLLCLSVKLTHHILILGLIDCVMYEGFATLSCQSRTQNCQIIYRKKQNSMIETIGPVSH